MGVRKWWVYPLAIVLPSILLVWALWSALDDERQATFRDLLKAEADIDAAIIEGDIRGRIPALQRVVHRWEVRGGTPKDEFLDDLSFYIRDLPGFQALEWVDKSFHVRWIEPLAGNEKAQDLNLAFEAERRRALEMARDKRTPTMTSAIDLVQGGKGFLVYFPIYRGDEFDGFLLAVFRIDAWLNHVFETMIHAAQQRRIEGYFIRSVSIDGVSVFGSDEASNAEFFSWKTSSNTRMLGHDVQVEIMPTRKFFDENSSRLPEIAAAVGFILSALIGLVTFLSQLASRAAKEAVKASTAKSNFLATMTHEIRTPLNGVLGLAQLLSHSKLDTDQRKKVDTILYSGQSLLAIISDVLDMSRIEAGGMELERGIFNVKDLISAVATPFQSLADEKALKLRVEEKIGSGYVVKGDAIRLRQILWNLLSNAIKFTSTGEVSLKIEDLSDQDGAEQADRRLFKFTVSDTGRGIASDRLDAIFEAFAQEDSSISRIHGGTGLGLSIVKQLTEIMGGSIRAESELDKGSKFVVVIPFEAVSDEEAETLLQNNRSSAAKSASPLNILIAEDNEVNAVIAQMFLEKLGHRVRHVENGNAAVEEAANEWVDFIFMDVHMPELNGIDATRKIRALDLDHPLPIVGLTAEAFVDRHAQLFDAGMDGVLTKPFTEEQMADIIETYRSVRTEHFPIGDDERLRTLKDGLDPDAFDELMISAAETLTTHIDDLRAGMKVRDSDRIFAAAHTIKGTAASLFAVRVAEMATMMENSASNVKRIGQLLPQFEKAVEETKDWWRGYSG